MTDADILEVLKADLQMISPTASMASYLATLIEASKKLIAQTGITLNYEDTNDCLLVVMYSAYLYRKRAESVNAMPRQLEYMLRNRLWAEKGRTA